MASRRVSAHLSRGVDSHCQGIHPWFLIDGVVEYQVRLWEWAGHLRNGGFGLTSCGYDVA